MSPKNSEQLAAVRKNTKEKLLEAAVKTFSEKGYHASSIALIAKAAHVSKGLTYHYFESKESLLVALVEYRLQEWLPLIEGLESIQDAKERLYFLVDFVLGELVKNTEKLRFYNSLYLHSDGVKAIEKAMKKYQDQFEILFRSERKIFSDLGFDDPDTEATFLRSLLQGICLEYMLGPKNYPLAEMKKRIFIRYGVNHARRSRSIR
jgi:AcrR family transcriptional regulator